MLVAVSEPGFQQDGVNGFAPGLRPGLAGDEARPLPAPFADEFCLPVRIPTHERQRREAQSEQAADLFGQGGGDDAGEGINLQQGFQEFGDGLLAVLRQFVEAVQKQERAPALEGILYERRDPPEVQEGSVFGGGVNDRVEDILRIRHRQGQVRDVGEERDDFVQFPKLRVAAGGQAGEVGKRNGFSDAVHADDDNVASAG